MNTKSILLALVSLLLLASCSSTKELSKAEKQAHIYYSHGTDKLIAGNYTAALDYLSKANVLKPNDSKTLNNLGMAYYLKKRVKLAIEFIKKSLEINPNNTDAKVNLASMYFDEKDYNSAEKLYLEVAGNLTYRHNYRTYYNLGLISLRKKNTRKAEHYFTKSIGVNESYCPSNFQLGLLARKRYQYSSALKWFKKSQIGDCAKSPSPHYQEIETLLDLGENATALSKMNFFIEKFPASPLAGVVSDHMRKIELSGNVFKSTKRTKTNKRAPRKEHRFDAPQL
jgi:Tfp pilus assembly protein PilF